ncbi:MAG: CARDB domain-containing protein [Thermoguttaceae bacterium]
MGAAVAGDYAYELTSSGLRVLDIADPDQITRVSKLVFPVDVGVGVHLEGDRLYTVDDQALRVFDVSVPHLPTLMAELDSDSYMMGSTTVRESVFFAGEGATLTITDLSDPAAPDSLASYGLRGEIQGIAVEGTKAYVSYFDSLADRGMLEVVDVADLSVPTFVSRRDLGATWGWSQGGAISASGNLLAVVGSPYEIQLIGVSDPTSPRVLGRYLTSGEGYSRSVHLSGTTLQVVGTRDYYDDEYYEYYDTINTLEVIDVSDPSDPAMLGIVELGMREDAIWDSGGGTISTLGTQTYVSGGEFRVVDVADRYNPQLAGGYAEPWGLEDIVLAGSVASMVTGDRLELIDVSEPSVPRSVGSYTAAADIDKVVASGQYVLLGEYLNSSYSAQIEVVDVSDPANPVHVVTHDMSGLGYVFDYLVDGDFFYVLGGQSYSSAGTGSLYVMDVSDPMNPVELSTTDLFLNRGSQAELALDDGRLFVSNTHPVDPEPNDNMASAIDLGDLSSPAVVRGVSRGPNDGSYDYYRFAGTEGDVLTVDLRGQREGAGTFYNGTIYLYDSDGNYLVDAYYYSGNDDNQGIIDGYELGSTGDYYVRVYGSNYNSSYELAVALNQQVPAPQPFNGLSVFDVSDPAAPAELSTANVGRLIHGMEVDASRAYVSFADPGMLEIWDFSDPTDPIQQGSAQVSEAGPLIVGGSLVSIASGSSVEVVDVSDPQRPISLASYETANDIGGFAAEGMVTFVASDSLYALSARPAGAETPDLAVTQVVVPEAVQLGSILPIDWSVRNHGRSSATGTWVDAAYLSSDAVLDEDDLWLAEASHTGPLDSLDIYSEQLSVAIDGVTPGNYYVIVRTDDLEDVNEWSVEANNVRVSPHTVYIGYPDVTVTHIGLPDVVQRGDLLPIEWTVFNREFAPAAEDWADNIYLSTDAEFDPQVDRLVATVSHTGGLEERAVYHADIDVDTTSIADDNYYVIVVTDTDGTLDEGDGEGNNVRVSDEPFSLGVPTLPLNTEMPGTFDYPGHGKYYNVTVDADLHLFVSLDDINDTGYNELYIKHGSAPTRNDYDARYSNNLASDQVVEIADTQAGDYYILAYAASAPDAPADFTLTASVLGFEILGVSPVAIGNAGLTTMSIRGSEIPLDAVPVLVGPDGTRHLATSIYQETADHLYPTFDLTGADPGEYDVRLESTGGVFSVLTDIVNVSAGSGGDLVAELTVPAAVRVGRPFTIYVDYSNAGDADVRAPVLLVTATGGVELVYEDHAPVPSGSTLQVLGISDTGPAGILRPGSSGRISIESVATRGNMQFSLTTLVGDDTPVDWDSYKESARRDSIDPTDWDPIWDDIVANIGDTWEDYLDTLDANATRRGLQGLRTASVRALFGMEIDRALGLGISVIAGVLTDESSKEPLANTAVIALQQVDEGTSIVRTDFTDAHGRFVIEGLSAGTYELFVDDYLLEPASSYEVTADLDVVGLELSADVVPSTSTPEPGPVAESDPYLATDAAGTPHMVWKRGSEIWHAYFDGAQWVDAAPIPGAAGGSPSIQAHAQLLDGDSPGMIATWQVGAGNESEVFYAIGRAKTGEGFEWSEPLPLTDDSIFDDNPTLIVTNAGQPLIVYQKSDFDITDDTDLYFDLLALSEGDATWPAKIQGQVIDDLFGPKSATTFGVGFNFKKQGSLPSWIPIIGGSNVFTIEGMFQGTVEGPPPPCTAEASAAISAKIKLFGGRADGFGNASGSAKWVADSNTKSWVLQEAKLTVGVGISADIPGYKVKFPPIVDLEVGLTVSGNISGTIGWQGSNFPDWPSSIDVGLGIGLGPYGKATFLGGSVEGKISGMGSVSGSIGSSGIKFGGGKLTIAADAKVWWFNIHWDKTWTFGGGKGLEPNVSFVDKSLSDVLIASYDPLVGTGNVYGSGSVLSDVSLDVYNDSAPAIAVGPDGEILMLWVKDADPATGQGSVVVAAEFDGTNWSAPVEIPGSDGFNGNVALAFDSNGKPVATWTRADIGGIDAASTSEEILQALDSRDLLYSVRSGDQWSAPAPVSATVDNASNPAIGVAPDGRLVSTWINEVDGDDQLMAAHWDGTGWTTGEEIATGVFEGEPSVGEVNGQTVAFWTQDVGIEPDVPEPSLFFSTFDATWSAPALFSPTILVAAKSEASTDAGDGGKSSSSGEKGGFSIPGPSDECFEDEEEEEEEEEEDDPPDPPDDQEEGEDEDDTDGIQSFDPNDKTGPAGFGGENYIVDGSLMPFTIFYENDPEFATAAAQIVRVEDQLDEDLDWSTFELGDINLFGDYVVSVDPGLNFLEKTVDHEPVGIDLLVRITAGIDGETGQVEWLFESLDRDTLGPPDDPFAGFLAVNDKETHIGEGHFEYFIRAKSPLASGTEITNQAFNYFDDNEPVPTPSTLHTIDSGLPISSVQALPAQVPDEPLLISWSGQDDVNGSGVVSYTIYVKRDDEQDWGVWLENTPETSGQFDGVGGHTYAFRAVAKDGVGHVEDDPGVAEATTLFDFSQLRVDWLETTPGGFVAHFLRELDSSVLNLYDVEAGVHGPSDFTVVGDTVGSVTGSLVYDAAAKTVTFLKTGGPLQADTYTVTLRSDEDALQDAEGHLLDGDGDGDEGGDFVATVTVEASTAKMLSLPDFTRGPGQPVDVPATGLGLPITIDDGTGVKGIDLTFTFDPDLLVITGASLGPDAPEGSSIGVNLSVPGQVTLAFYTIGTLNPGQGEIITLTAEVPDSADYGRAHVLDFTNVSINDGEILAAGVDAIHIAAFFGDATGNQAYSSMDARAVARVEVELDSGFEQYPTIDPVVIADITGNGALSGMDAGSILSEAIGIDMAEIPPLPASGSKSTAARGETADRGEASVGFVMAAPIDDEPDDDDKNLTVVASSPDSGSNAGEPAGIDTAEIVPLPVLESKSVATMVRTVDQGEVSVGFVMAVPIDDEPDDVDESLTVVANLPDSGSNAGEPAGIESLARQKSVDEVFDEVFDDASATIGHDEVDPDFSGAKGDPVALAEEEEIIQAEDVAWNFDLSWVSEALSADKSDKSTNSKERKAVDLVLLMQDPWFDN